MTQTTGEAASPQADGDAPTAARHDILTSYDVFTSRVSEMCTRPGQQQALRVGLGRSMDDMPCRTHAALLRHGLIPDRASNADKRAYYAVAALIAARPRAERRADNTRTESSDPTAAAPVPGDRAKTDPDDLTTERQPNSWGTTLGESLAALTTRRTAQPAAEDATSPTTQANKISGVEQRLHLLVRQDIDGVHRMLPALVRQLGSAGVTVDYGRLLHDLLRWPHRRTDIATRWLEDYYRTLRRAERRT
ncbi:type I-E CRISPR-associated protein Cse2/CasB [Streptomyces sp. NPDC046324]|uniref:type I-E CRISPR-associated protein Cse2/CasB n=1 Tax=Streptomyces sp. NPDC046324 TaxID=3154915 RepID=UPI0033DA04A5